MGSSAYDGRSILEVVRQTRSPRDSYITVYGRKPVLEALHDPQLQVAKVIVAHNAQGESLDAVVGAARERGVKVYHAPPHRVKSLAGNGRHDQGVVADVVAPRLRTLDEFLARPGPEALPGRVLVLDGVSNPANVGLILRTAAATGLGAVALPRVGSPDLGPLVVKASAGTAFSSPVLRCHTAAEALEQLAGAGYTTFGLAADAPEPIFRLDLPEHAAFAVGGETGGVSPAARPWVSRWVSIPMAERVESLNVASAVAMLGYELLRRRLVSPEL
jgi:23S rRNA (guanosine2251-2'-O)-methyltransferase